MYFLNNNGVQAFASFKLRNSEVTVTGQKFSKFLHNVTRSWQMNLLISELRYSTPFRNAKATNVGKSADFAHFNRKIGCHGNVP